jgi:hypothetical protein
MDTPSSWGTTSDEQELVDLFIKIGLAKYTDLFQQQEVSN